MLPFRRNLIVLGSTGSIGRQTLEVAAACHNTVTGITFHRNVALAEEQIRQFHPLWAATPDEAAAADLRVRVADVLPAGRILGGEEGVLHVVSALPKQMVVSAIVGIAGLRPTLAAIDAGHMVALANKEALVCAGQLVMERAREKKVHILPVDSEHSAIFQCLQNYNGSPETAETEIQKLILTASGGPFFGMDQEALAHVTVADALKHPTWQMGQKITIDSATLMNKGLEVIEAMRLFGVPAGRIEVMVHREGVVHSMVEFNDGAVLAQMGAADMRLPIQYALGWPARTYGPAKHLDLLSCPPLTFQKPDMNTFRCLALAYGCAQIGGTSTAILNGANEAAVDLFLKEKIGFLDIPRLVEGALGKVVTGFGTELSGPGLEEIFEADRAARQAVYDMTR